MEDQILHYDTFNGVKARIMSNIKVNMELIESFKRDIERNPENKDDWGETIAILNAEIKQDVQNLIALKRERIRKQLGDDEVYERKLQTTEG